MANIAIFASGNGSNFEALVKSLNQDQQNRIAILFCNNKNAYVLERAKKINTRIILLDYKKQSQKEVENNILKNLKTKKIDIIFLAGFMKILSKFFLDQLNIPILNIHPSLLPHHKGINAIEKAFIAGDENIGITIHHVNEEVDSGNIIFQKSIKLDKRLGLDHIENQIHQLEHKWYPVVAKRYCDFINNPANKLNLNFTE